MSSDEVNERKEDSNLFAGATYGNSLDDEESMDIVEPIIRKVKRVSSEYVTLGGIPKGPLSSRPSIATSERSLVLGDKGGSLEQLVNYDDYDQVSITSQASEAAAGGGGSSNPRKRKKDETENLEAWWVSSPTWRRTTVFMCITLFIMTIVNTGVAIYFLAAEDVDTGDPYVCQTQSCQEMSAWVVESMNRNADPCENFYEYICGNHQAPDIPITVPPEARFTTATTQFSGEAFIARLLIPSPEFSPKIIPFYKSCIDLRRRNTNNMDVFAAIVNDTFAEVFENITGYLLSEGPAKIHAVSGSYALFGFQFRTYPHIAILPPPQWTRDLRDYFINNPVKYAKVRDIVLPSFFRTFWKHLKLTNPPMTPDAAAKGFLTHFELLVQSWNTFEILINNITKEEKDSVFDILQRVWAGENATLVESDVGTLRYTIVDLLKTFLTFRRTYAEDNLLLRKNVLAMYVFNLLEYFANDFRGTWLTELELAEVFPEIQQEDQLSESRYCLNALISNLKGYAVVRLTNSFGLANNKLLTETVEDTVRRIQRVYRRMYTTKINTLLQEHHAYITEAYTNFNHSIKVIFPYDTTNDQTVYEEVDKYFDSFEASPDHLTNVYLTGKLFRAGRLNAWRNNRLEQLKRRNFFLENIEEHTDNFLDYENGIYPPIALFDRPFVQNDLKVYFHAGTVVYLARSFLRLWGDNIKLYELHQAGPLANLLNTTVFNALLHEHSHNEIECLGDESNESAIVDFASNATLLNALAFKIGIELLRNSNIYETPRDFVTGELKPSIEPVFEQDGTVRYMDIEQNGTGPDGEPQFINRDEFDNFNPKSFKLIFKKAPGPLLNFTEDQIYFMATVRHHCFAKDREGNVLRRATNTNNALRQLTEFGETWNCKKGSHMNPTPKCL